jgi:hypothetical protein
VSRTKNGVADDQRSDWDLGVAYLQRRNHGVLQLKASIDTTSNLPNRGSTPDRGCYAPNRDDHRDNTPLKVAQAF